MKELNLDKINDMDLEALYKLRDKLVTIRQSLIKLKELSEKGKTKNEQPN